MSLPHLSGHIYLVTSEGGQYRLAILGRPTIAGSLYGILTTLLVGHGSQLVPAACPIALLRIGEAAEPAFGRIEPGHPAYAAYRAELDAVTGRDYRALPGRASAAAERRPVRPPAAPPRSRRPARPAALAIVPPQEASSERAMERPRPGAALLAAAGVEGLEDALAVGGGDAGAVVGDA